DAEAITWLEKAAADDPDLYTTLASFYERAHRPKDAAAAYAKALQASPRNADLKLQYALSLMQVGGKDALSQARDLLNDVVAARPNDVRSLFQLSQAQRRLMRRTRSRPATPRSPRTLRRPISPRRSTAP